MKKVIMNREARYFSFFIMLLLIMLSNAYVFVNYRKQQIVISDSDNLVPTISINEAENLNITYPNLTVHTYPVNTYLGRVYLREKLYDKAIKAFHTARSQNPFLRMNEYYLSEVYDEMGLIDSAQFYKEIAFKKMPNHPLHFYSYLKSVNDKDTTAIDTSFQRIKFKSKGQWKIFLTKVLNVEEKSTYQKNQLKVADSLFFKDAEVKLLVDYNLYGKDLILNKINLVTKAEEKIKSEAFSESLELLRQIPPKLYDNRIYDVFSTSFYNLSKYDSSLFYLNKINLNKLNDKGRFHLVKGLNYLRIGDTINSCKELDISYLNNNKRAFILLTKHCK